MLARKMSSFCIIVFFLCVSVTNLYASDGLIEKVVFQGKNNKSESVVFHLNGPWLPKAFALPGEKPRVVFDFKGTGLKNTVPSVIHADGALISKIRFGRYENKTRVVIDLTGNEVIDFDRTFDEVNNILTIQLYPGHSPLERINQSEAVEQEHAIPPAPVEEIVSTMIEGTNVKQKTEPVVDVISKTEHSFKEEGKPGSVKASLPGTDALLVDVSFENTSNKGEMVLFKLNGFYPPVVRGQEETPPRVICEFEAVRLGDKVIKEQVIDGQYIKHLRVEQVDDRDFLQVTLELMPDKDYDLQQVFFKEDNLFVVIVNSYESTEREVE